MIETLEHHPEQWPVRMLYVMRAQPPGIAWVGQVAAALGLGMGAAGPVLLGVVVCAMTLTLWLVRRTALALGGSRWGASMALGVLAASPLFIGLSRQFFVESLQTAAVAWVVWLAAVAPGRSRLRNGIELAAAVSVAMLAKATSPLYIAAPVVLVLVRAGREECGERHSTPSVRPGQELSVVPGGEPGPGGDRRLDTGTGAFERPGAIAALGLVLATGVWYARNWSQALEHLTSGNALVGRLYGEESGLVASLQFWAGAIQQSFLLPWAGLVAGVALAAGAFESSSSSSRRIGLRGLVAAALFHVLLVVGVLVFTHNREPRFLLPLVPYLAVFTGIIASRIRTSWPILLAGAALFCQGVYVQALSFGLGNFDPRVSHWVTPLDLEGTHARQLEATFLRTCGAADSGPTFVMAELPWLNVNSLAFRAASEPWPAPERCTYAWPGATGAVTADEIWAQLESSGVSRLVVVDPVGVAASSDPAVNATGPAIRAVLERLRASSAFVEERALKENLAVRFFRRTQGRGSSTR